MSDIQYVKSVILKQTFLNDSTVVNVNCNNRAWAGNNMHGGFYNAQNLQSVTGINDSVTNTSYTFGECSNLQSVSSLPTNTVTLEACFINCTSLINAPTIPSSVVSLNTTFYGCTNLASCGTLPNTVLLMDGTFYNCRNLTSAPNIPDNVLTMGYTFAGCRNLTSAPDAPDHVTNMAGTYGDCIKLVNPPKLSNTVTSLPSTFMFDEALTDIPAIPNSVTNMYQTFLLCTNLGDLANSVNKLSNSVTDMYLTFSKTGITSAPVIPNSVVNMQDTFYMCDNLTSMPTIPNSVTKLAGTFQCCYNLVNVTTIPSSVTNMGAGGTDQWPETESQHVIDSGCFAYCRSLTSVPTIPNSVTDVCGCFSHCYNLTTPTPYALPQSVINAAECFASCNNITQIIIPSAVTNMRDTFNNCTNLTDVYIQSSVVNNVYNCFEATTATKNVYVPFNTTTYNTFVNAGYDDQGTKEGVYLKNICVLTINPTPADATITFSTGNISGNVCAVEPNTSITYTVTKDGYIPKTNTITITENQTINISLDAITATYINGYIDNHTDTYLYKANNQYYTKSGNTYTQVDSSAVTEEDCCAYLVWYGYGTQTSGVWGSTETDYYYLAMYSLRGVNDTTFEGFPYLWDSNFYTRNLITTGTNYNHVHYVTPTSDVSAYTDADSAVTTWQYSSRYYTPTKYTLNNNIHDCIYNNKIYRYFNPGIDSPYTYKAYTVDKTTHGSYGMYPDQSVDVVYLLENVSDFKYKTTEYNQRYFYLPNGTQRANGNAVKAISPDNSKIVFNNYTSYRPDTVIQPVVLIRTPELDTNTLPTA